MPSGTVLSGEYIVALSASVKDIRAAIADVHARAAVAVAAVSGDEASIASESVTVLSASPSPAQGVGSHLVLKVPASIDPRAVRASLLASEGVEAVVQNRVVRTAQAHGAAKCQPPHFAAGVQAPAAAGLSFTWESCLDGSSQLAMFGERCGPALNKFRWTGIYTYKKDTGALVKNCIKLRSSESSPQRIAQLFGECGVAPKHFANLPTSVCTEAADSPCAEASSLASYRVDLSRALCSTGSPKATFTGVPCGPAGALIQWNNLSPAGCLPVDRSTADPKSIADWIGQCGVPPQQITGLPTRVCGRTPPGGGSDRDEPTSPPADGGNSGGSADPSPPPPSARVPKTAVKSGESANWGVGRVGAYDRAARTVPDVAAAAKAGKFVVAVVDTGVDAAHPDLEVAEFVDFVDAAGSTYYKKDGNGHGTHCGGIIAAKNQGSGIFGVVPGMPLLALKVLSKDGSGPLENVYAAYKEIISRLQKGEKIVSINLSLSSQTDDADAKAYECGLVAKIQAFGTAVAAAAGNDGEALDFNLPAACMQSMTVTSLDVNDNPSYFSNFAAVGNAKAASLLAAPGHSIYSTYTGGGYQTLSGTSMATPFVAGSFAYCFLSSACQFGSAAVDGNYKVLMAAAAAGGCSSSSSKCGPQWGTGNYYGNMVNVRQF